MVITGAVECRNPAEWRDIAYRAIAAAAGCSIQITDAFRLGRFTEGRRRPILVKLNTVWDRRLVLIGGSKLRVISEFSRVYITADEPPEVRRKKTFERLKAKAEREHKAVSVSNGVLSIELFSLGSGFINSSQSSDQIAINV